MKTDFVRWSYGDWIENLRDVEHLSDSQLARIGAIVAHRLRYRNKTELAQMIFEASRELHQQMEGDDLDSANATGEGRRSEGADFTDKGE